MIGQLPKERLLIRSTPTQGDETDSVMREIQLAAHQPMQPMAIHEIGVSEHLHTTLVVTPADEDHGAVQGAVEIEFEPLWKWPPRWSAVSAAGSFATVGGDIPCRNARQARDVGTMVALPDLTLPKCIKALN